MNTSIMTSVTYKLNFKQFLNDISFKVSACHNATAVLNSVLTNIN